MFLFRYFSFSNGIGHQVMKNFEELRNDGLFMIGVVVGKHVHGVFPICKKLNTVSLALGITSIK